MDLRRSMLCAVLVLGGCAGENVVYAPGPGMPASSVDIELEGCRDDARLIYDSDERERNVQHCMVDRGFKVSRAPR